MSILNFIRGFVFGLSMGRTMRTVLEVAVAERNNKHNSTVRIKKA